MNGLLTPKKIRHSSSQSITFGGGFNGELLGGEASKRAKAHALHTRPLGLFTKILPEATFFFQKQFLSTIWGVITDGKQFQLVSNSRSVPKKVNKNQ